MDKERILKERHNLLERMADELQDDLIPAVFREPENENDLPLVSVLFNEMGEGDEEAYGEFFFRPFESDDDEVQFFSGIITLSDNVPKEHLPELYEAMSYINFQLPCGCFALDKTRSFLCFQENVPLPMELSGDALYEQMNIVSGNAAAVSDAYMSTLLQVAEGEMTIEEVVELLGGRDEEQA